MPFERFDFPGAHGQKLAARLDLPDGPVRAFALLAHCFTCGKNITVASRIATALAVHGIATLRFDFTGLGGSDGEFANTDFSSNCADLLAAVAHLRASGRAPKLLIGHSLGGAAILAVAGDIPEARAVATIGAPFDVAHVVGQFRDRVPEIERQGEAVVNLAGRPFTIRRRFLEDVAHQDQQARIARLHRALLVLHAPRDEVVGVDHARRIFEAAHHPKSFLSLDDADHLLTRAGDADWAANLIAGWAAHYLPAAEAVTGNATPSGAVVVEETGRGRFQQAVTAGRHRFLADEPSDVGGLDSGPGPYDLLLAGLGACTSMTLRMYAERKKLPLARVRVTLAHRRTHAEDCVDCDEKDRRIEIIDREVTLDGELSEDERVRLLEIADKCPVHRTLNSHPRIETRLARG